MRRVPAKVAFSLEDVAIDVVGLEVGVILSKNGRWRYERTIVLPSEVFGHTLGEETKPRMVKSEDLFCVLGAARIII